VVFTHNIAPARADYGRLCRVSGYSHKRMRDAPVLDHRAGLNGAADDHAAYSRDKRFSGQWTLRSYGMRADVFSGASGVSFITICHSGAPSPISCYLECIRARDGCTKLFNGGAPIR
jgi:hypothetical protein